MMPIDDQAFQDVTDESELIGYGVEEPDTDELMADVDVFEAASEEPADDDEL